MIFNGSLSTTISGRRKKLVRATSAKKLYKNGNRPNLQQSDSYRRETPNYPSASELGDGTFKVEKPEAVGVTVAPAYNKGAYQVIPRDDIKHIGR